MRYARESGIPARRWDKTPVGLQGPAPRSAVRACMLDAVIALKIVPPFGEEIGGCGRNGIDFHGGLRKANGRQLM